jgi:hypothetical protein
MVKNYFLPSSAKKKGMADQKGSIHRDFQQGNGDPIELPPVATMHGG